MTGRDADRLDALERRVERLERELARHGGAMVHREAEPEPAPLGPRRLHDRRRVIVGVSIVAALALAGGLAWVLVQALTTTVEGYIHGDGEPLGAFQARLAGCDAGTGFVPQFLGADLEAVGAEEDARYRLQLHADKRLAFLTLPGQSEAITLTPEQCSNFQIDIRLTNVTVNDVRAIDGRFFLECAVPPAGRLQAEGRFETCY
ncbi:MAG: hypothetical protein GYA21_20280 [Myxococcales bacterium]|nr:hypothetical protein [Myxococcales bacterium]